VIVGSGEELTSMKAVEDKFSSLQWREGGVLDLPTVSTNPKDLIGAKKVPLGLLPAAGKIQGALAAAYGASIYQPYNWREKKVSYTIYLDAMERHLLALRDGEDNASDSGVSHLGHIIAGASIIADAHACGSLIDDRPRGGPAANLLERFNDKQRSNVSEVPTGSREVPTQGKSMA